MKTQKDIEKEIENWKYYEVYEYEKKVMKPSNPDELNILQALLQSKEFIERI